ncbi:MAG: elongation factor G [Anaerolineae bacterium]|jgi:elongation factor G|nr:elongation factor G [Chloroflexota bacterium]
MTTERLHKIRNIGIIAHIDAGKTTTTERILYHTGTIHRSGNVDDGNTTTDFMVQERERGITIQSAAITSFWRGYQLNLIDTPGHIDFTSEVQRSLRVLDGGVVAFDGVAGVEPQSETVWRQADRYGVPRMAFINKLDRPGASVDRSAEMIRERLGAHPVVLQMPIGREDSLAGVIDLVRMRALSADVDGHVEESPIPEQLQAEAEQRRDQMLAALADVDDEVALLYLDNEPVPPELFEAALRGATIAGRAIPVVCGSSLRNVGVVPLLDAVIAYLPSPSDVPAIVAKSALDGDPVTCPVDSEAPLAALVFKISTDPYVGKLSFFRIYSGTIARGDVVTNTTTGESAKVGRLVRMHADRREEVDAIQAGDIGAVLGLKLARTGETLATSEQPVVLEDISFPTPVIELSITAGSKAGEERLGNALARLLEEDPTLTIKYNEQTRESTLAGMGELHLDVIVDRLRREFNVDVVVGKPKVAYCETITRAVSASGRLVKQSGGHGQFAVVDVEVEPLEQGGGFVFENAITAGAIPKQFIPSIEKGIREALREGPFAKQPVVDIKVRVVDGKFHEVDSSDRAFQAAGALALREAVQRGHPILLEPTMKVEVISPQEYTGDLIGDLSGRAAIINGIEPRTAGGQAIHAQVPLANMFGYATTLRSLTQGRGSFTMQFSHYQRASEEATKELHARVA